MRVLLGKIHCPSFICFCKPSSHIYKSGPLKLENAPHVVSSTSYVSATVPVTSDHLSSEIENPKTTIEVKEVDSDGNQQVEKNVDSSLEKAPLGTDIPITTAEVKEGDDLDGNQEVAIVLKSSLKKASKGTDTPKEAVKKRVQWIDNLGDELVEIKEFEASELDDSDNEGENRGCVCIIL